MFKKLMRKYLKDDFDKLDKQIKDLKLYVDIQNNNVNGWTVVRFDNEISPNWSIDDSFICEYKLYKNGKFYCDLPPSICSYLFDKTTNEIHVVSQRKSYVLAKTNNEEPVLVLTKYGYDDMRGKNTQAIPIVRCEA